jgi:MurNAc alpha-1-phosphate uridylyltransferase
MTQTAMILAAGLGTRMRPITDTLPKALVRVGGRTLIDRAIDILRGQGVDRIVVNVHYRAELMRAHLATVDAPRVLVSDESGQLLDSGGGVVHALPLLGTNPFFILNADTFWIGDDAGSSNLQRMAEAWREDRMDMLLLTAKLDQCTGYEGKGDFLTDVDGRLRRHDGQSADPVAYTGAAILHPGIFDDAPSGPFSLNRCFDRAIASGRLFGCAMQGRFITVGTPAAIAEAEAALSESATTS